MAANTGRKRRKKRSKSISYALYIIYILGLLIIIGNIIGSSLYTRTDGNTQNMLLDFVNQNIRAFDPDHWSFNEVFYRQFMYQGSMWVLGLSVIGVFVNFFLVFLRGVVAGFNLFFIFNSLGFFPALWTSILWLIQYGLILGVTILSGYFSIRFVIMSIKILIFKKNTAMFQKHLLYYFYQLVIIMILTLFTSSVTFIVQPWVFNQFERAKETQVESSNDFISTASEEVSQLTTQIHINFGSDVL